MESPKKYVIMWAAMALAERQLLAFRCFAWTLFDASISVRRGDVSHEVRGWTRLKR